MLFKLHVSGESKEQYIFVKYVTGNYSTRRKYNSSQSYRILKIYK